MPSKLVYLTETTLTHYEQNFGYDLVVKFSRPFSPPFHKTINLVTMAAYVFQKTIAPQLLAWWDADHADLPWRSTRDPYAIWVSEIMLQQTQITTVIPYYERWLTRFPTVQALAAASLDDVLKLWEGLGLLQPRPQHARRRPDYC